MPQAAIALKAVPVPEAPPEAGVTESKPEISIESGHIAGASAIEREDMALRRVTLRNMRLLKRDVLPLLAIASRAGQQGVRDGTASEACQGNLSRITHEILGLIDDTVIHAALDRGVGKAELCDIGRIARRVIAADCGEIRLSRAHIRIGRLPVLRVCEPLIAMLFEELFVTVVRNARAGDFPEIAVSATEDGQGNPVVLLTGVGVLLSSRKQAYAGQGSPGSARQEIHAWSMCRRLAEMAGASFETFKTETGSVQVSIRFPKRLAGGECRYAPER